MVMWLPGIQPAVQYITGIHLLALVLNQELMREAERSTCTSRAKCKIPELRRIYSFYHIWWYMYLTNAYMSSAIGTQMASCQLLVPSAVCSKYGQESYGSQTMFFPFRHSSLDHLYTAYPISLNRSITYTAP